MKFFAKKENVEKIRHEIEQWLGAPFSLNRCVKYKKTDCGRLVGSIYKDVGIFKRHPKYQDVPKQWFHHNASELLLDQVRDSINNDLVNGVKVKSVNVNNFLIGDMVLFCINKLGASNHVGVYVGDGYFLHASEGSGVTLAVISRFRKFLTKTYRAYICQQQQD